MKRGFDVFAVLVPLGLALVIAVAAFHVGAESTVREARKTVRAGERRCAQAWLDILRIPVGGIAVVDEPQIVVKKTALRELSYYPVATTKQRAIADLFTAPPAPPPSPSPSPTPTPTPAVKK